MDEDEIIRIYGERWDIEVFFKVCKSYLGLSRECNSLFYDAMTAHTAVVLPGIWCSHWKTGKQTTIALWVSFFYTFLMKCLISHRYRLFK